MQGESRLKETIFSADTFRPGIQERYRRVCGELGMTSSELSKRSGMSKAYLYRIEKGETIPGVDLCLYLADTFSVNIHWLLYGTGNVYTDQASREEPNAVPIDNREYARIQEQVTVIGHATEMLQKMLGSHKNPIVVAPLKKSAPKVNVGAMKKVK